MMQNSSVRITVKDQVYEVPMGTKAEALVQEIRKPSEAEIVAFRLNNTIKELSYPLTSDMHLDWIDITDMDGVRIYQRSLSFVLIRAAMELYDGIRVTVEHSLNKGLYFEFKYDRNLEDADIEAIKIRMRQIVEADEPFVKERVPKEQASQYFEQYGMISKNALLKYRTQDFINLYALGWLKNYFYGYMVPSTGYLKVFDLKRFADGAVLLFPNKFSKLELPEYIEQPKLAQIYKESEQWGEILGVEFVADLNDWITEKQVVEIMRVQEALQEKKIAQIADQITESQKRLILIAGPSSSGKTTFANRLMVQLKVNGLKPITLSTDDYFVDREHTPLDEDGKYDFESIDSVDVQLFNENLAALLRGEEVELPTFNFRVGKREYLGRKMQIHPDQTIIIEGIHGLNERLTSAIDKKDKFKIYISALTTLSIDDHNRIPTTDTRLFRRIVRDHRSRGYSALTTIGQWPSVRRGEEKNIFPFQEEADVMFNSAMVHELAVLKKYAQPLLLEIDETKPEYTEAKRLLKFLSYFKSIEDEKQIPPTSILREFIGGSSFEA